MTVYFKDRDVTKDDVADIGYFDLRNGNSGPRSARPPRGTGSRVAGCSGA